MTVIADTLADIGYDNTGHLPYVTFTSVGTDPKQVIRDSADSTKIIVHWRHKVNVALDGTFTTDDLEPGPARVQVGHEWYDIEIPDSETEIRLWPLIDAGIQPTEPSAHFVVNGGGVRRLLWVTQAEWAALAPGDPDTTYFVTP